MTSDHDIGPEVAYVAPVTAVEQVLTEAFARALGVYRVGVHDNFFSLGGDSILSVDVVTEAREAGVHVSLRQVFEHPTVAELAGVAEAEPVNLGETGHPGNC